MSERATGGAGGLMGNLTVTIQEAEQAYSSVSREALEDLLSRGIALPERPDFRGQSEFVNEDGTPVMPFNIAELPESDIGELYTIITVFFAYVVGQYSKAKNDLKEATEHFNLVKAKVRLGKEGAQKDKDDKKITDRRYVEARKRLLRTECMVELINAVVSKLEAEAKLVSRNITMRGEAYKGANRDASNRRRQVRRAWATDNESSTPPKEERYEEPRPTARPPSRPSLPGKRRAPPKRKRP